MDDLGSNLAGDTRQMETPVNTPSELRKRRSTRIVQAVPLQVTGVDALGRPFVERTSSLILNCHGCRYQSKHYVLKNMWVKLEIPHADSEQPAHTVRGRVAWIQRPRTVRQLFQVALELETPGNVWGIGFPPEDWFGFVEADKSQAQSMGGPSTSPYSMPSVPPAALLGSPLAQQTTASPTQPSAPEAESHVSLGEPEPSPSSSPDNVRVFPSPASTTDASLQLARHVTRLLAEARQQIQAAAREAAAQAVAAERRITAEQWDRQVTEARATLAQELLSAIEKVQEEASTRGRAAHETAAALLQEELPRRLAPQFEELTRSLTGKLFEEGQAQRAGHQQHLAEMSEAIRTLVQQAEEASARLRTAAAETEGQIGSRVEAAQKQIEEAARQREETAGAQRETIEAAAHAAQQQIASSVSSAQEQLQSHLGGELEAAQTRWQIAVDNSFAAAHERAAGVLNERANGLRSELQQEAERHADTVRQAAAHARDESERHAGGLRDALNAQAAQMEATLARANEASSRLENFSARLETVQQHALSGFQSQVDDVLNLHRNELHRRSESIFEEITARIRGAFEQSSQQAVSQFSRQVESLVQPHIDRTDEAMQRLAGGRSLLDAAVTMHQERIRATTDEAFSEALSQFRGNLGGIEESLRQSADAVTSRSLADLEGRVEGVKHKAVEDLVQSGEWYEKKAMTQIQGLADKVGEQTAAELREKAGEVANEFSGEMDQSSRNFISYAQTQMAEVVSDSFDRVRGLFTEAAETTTAAFIDEIQRHARQDLEAFDSELQKSAVEARLHLDAAHADLTQKVSAEQEDFLRRFQGEMTGAVEAGVANANQRVQAGFEPLLKSWKSMTEAHQTEMYHIYTKLGEQAAQQYRERLDNVSNQWMLATVTSLDHQSRDAVARIAVSAEERLRETCTKVFADIGDSLRERLKEISSNLNIPAKGTTPSEP
jgi:archaellum component FlaC